MVQPQAYCISKFFYFFYSIYRHLSSVPFASAVVFLLSFLLVLIFCIHLYMTLISDLFVFLSSHTCLDADLLVHTASRGFLQNGPDAIALYRGHVGAFPFGTSVTGASLIDAVVYATNNKQGRRLVNVLVPGMNIYLSFLFSSLDILIQLCIFFGFVLVFFFFFY